MLSLWAFQDENQTGEPNYKYVEGEEFVFNEAYGETNERWIFLSYLFLKRENIP